MTVQTLDKPGSTAEFPATSVEMKLRSVLLESVKSTASIQGILLPSSTLAIYALAVQLDSLEVVNLLCDVEPILGFELKDSIVKAGGYQSIDAAISHLMPRIAAAWQKHRSNRSKGGKK